LSALLPAFLSGARPAARHAPPAGAHFAVESLVFAYEPGKPVFDGLALDVRPGEFLVLIGPSGCGKTTLLNLLSGFLAPQRGRVTLAGAPVRPEQPELGYVFQAPQLFAWLSVLENVRFGLRMAGTLDVAEQRRRSREALALVGLDDAADRLPHELSGGMRQRVSLMRTLISGPEILLMDEPFGALDTHTKLEMHKTLLEIWERERQTVLFVTHDLGEALTLASRIILLSARPGRLKEDFDVAIPRPRDPVGVRETAEFGRLYSHIWHSLGEEFRRTRAD